MCTPWIRAALARCAFIGISGHHLGRLVAELAEGWTAGRESQLHNRRGHERCRAAGGGRKHELVFADRVVVTLVALRLQIPHAALAALHGVHRSTITRAVRQVRPLLAGRGYAAPTGVRLRTLDDVFAYAAANNVTLRIDGSEVQARPPRANRPGRRAFASGKKKQNTIKFTEVTDEAGRTLWAGAFRPGRMHDQTAVKTCGIDQLFDQHPQVSAECDNGYKGLAKAHPNQVSIPPKKPGDHASGDELAAWQVARTNQSTQRICVEHGIGELKHRRPLQRWIGRRDDLPQTIAAIGSLVSDRAATR